MTMKMMKRSGHRLAEFGLLVLVGLAILPIVGIDARASALPWYYGGDDGNVIYVAVGESIQDAIDAAGDGWTVELAPGEHVLYGSYGLTIYGKSITLRGSLDGYGTPASRIQGSYGAPLFDELLYTSLSPAPTIENLVVSGGYGGYYGTAVRFTDGSPTIRNCVIADNGPGSDFGYLNSAVLFGGESAGGELRIFDTVIRDNGTIGLRINGNGTTVLDNCLITGNSDVYGANAYGVYAPDREVTLIDTVVCGNGYGTQVLADVVDGGGNCISVSCDDCDGTTGTGISFVDSGQALGDDASHSVALGDLDGDGDLDAMVANVLGPNTVWFNDGTGYFGDSGQSLGNADSFSVALGDLDGDGDLDAAVANFGVNAVWINDGTGTFTDSGQTLGGSNSESIALGDLDGDGDLDAWVANGFSAPNTVWTNDGTGTFTDSGQTLGNSSSESVALGDLDGDGDLDAMVANLQALAAVWINDGTGSFTKPETTLIINGASIALGDLDGDGDLDAMIGRWNNVYNSVAFNDGTGLFTDSGQELGNSNSTSIALGDLDADGDLDAMVANLNQPNLVWINDGTGTFIDSGRSLGASASKEVALGDLDADGDLDAMVANGTIDEVQPNTVWFNTTQIPDPPFTVCLDGSCPYTTVQDAIDAATNGGVITVSGETYLLDATIDTNGKAVTIRGAVDPVTGEPTTVLDGQGTHRVLQCVSNEGPDTAFEHLVVQHGYASQNGGGMYLGNYSEPTLTNCTFTNNSAQLNGGGMYQEYGSSTLTNCRFTNNSVQSSSSNSGGGIHMSCGTTTLIDCTITNNSRFGLRGTCSNTPFVLINTTVCGNSGGQVSGGWINGGGSCVSEVCDDGSCDTQTITVCPTGCDHTTIDEALLASTPYDRIDVAAGTYLVSSPIYIGERSITIRGSVDPVTGEPTTILDGQGATLIMTCQSVGPDTVLENLVFQNGSIDGDNYQSAAGLSIQDAWPTIRNCTFRNNQGGGLSAYANSTPPGLSMAVTDCRFLNNTSGADGGGASITSISAEISRCTFTNNTTTSSYSSGGGLRTGSYDSDVVISVADCTFTGNQSSYGGGASAYASNYDSGPAPSVTFTNCFFEANSATAEGGALEIYGDAGILGGPVVHSSTFVANVANQGGAVVIDNAGVIDDCHFESNVADVGGAILCDEGEPGRSLVTNSTFQDNLAVLAGGAIGLEDEDATRFENNRFEGNEAAQGGAVVVKFFSTPSFDGNQFIDNEAPLGGAVYVDSNCQISLRGDQFDGNRAYYGAGLRNFGGICSLEDVTMQNNALIDPQAVFGSATAILNREGVVLVTGSTFQNNSVDGSYNFSINSDEGVVFFENSVLCGTNNSEQSAQYSGALIDEGGNCIQQVCTDCIDNCPDDPDKTEPGLCGCGVPDTDSDLDGTPDCLDDCPSDPEKTAPGQCGCGTPDTDSDEDGLADCVDPCPTWPGACSEDGLTYFYTEALEDQGTSLQMAVDTIASGGTVLVAPGTYAGPIDFGGRAVSLISELGAEQTIIDGSSLLDGSIVSFVSGEGPETLLSGFTLSNGTIGTLSGSVIVGGAIVCRDSSPTIEACRFTNNAADFGGAVHCFAGAPEISDCIFENNEASFDGGAMMLSRTNAIVERSEFSGNTAGVNGGALHVIRGAVLLRQLTLESNTATNNGGGLNYGSYVDGTLQVNSCVITENDCIDGIGGGIHFEDVSILPVLVGTTVCDNTPQDIAGEEFIDSGGNTICDAVDCPADLNGDGTVDGADLTLLLADWGCTGAGCIGDFDGSGTVDGADLTIILSAWGDCE